MLAPLLVLPQPTAHSEELPSSASWNPRGGRHAGLMWSGARGCRNQEHCHTNLREKFTEKAPTWAFSWLKPSLAILHLRHYAKLAPKHCKKT